MEKIKFQLNISIALWPMGIDEICKLQLTFEEADMRLIPHIQ